MAIGPKAIFNPHAAADIIETKIDAHLRNLRQSNTGNVSIHGVSAEGEVLQILRKRYTEAGWADLTSHSDYRDGSYITLHTTRRTYSYMDR